MIIEAKANRETGNMANQGKQFELAPEKTSRLPLFVALAITAVATFFKSVLPAASMGPTDPAQPNDGASSANMEAPRNGRAVAGGPAIDNTTTGGIDHNNPDNTIGGSVSWPQGFVLPDIVAINYTSGSDLFGPRVSAFFPAAFGYHPENDNFVTVRPTRAAATNQAVIAEEAIAPSLDPVPNDTKSNEDAEDEDGDDDGGPRSGNRSPIVAGPVQLRDVFAGQVVLIGLSQLLFGASDPDGDALSINDISLSGGSLAQVGTGWSFATVPGMLGLVTFTYVISDGMLEILQTAMLNVVRNSVHLSPGNDVFVGTPFDDDIDALAGDDIIDARAGNDIVVGSLGDDHILGGDGDDELFGGMGDDVIFGGAGNDIIGGGDGNDRLFGDDGNDVIDGDAGADFIMGGAGHDILNGGDGDDRVEGEDGNDIIGGQTGNDMLIGGAGNDIINGGSGNDELFGGDGDDVLNGDDGNDQVFGGSGDDLLSGGLGDDALFGEVGDDTFMGDAGDDEIDGGDGYDTLDYSQTSAALYVDTEAGTAHGDDIGNDGFQNIEQINGGAGNDTFVIGATAKVISGGRGHDLFIFTVNDDAPTLSHQLVQQILDFVVGDRIYVADYEISHRAEKLEEQRFEELYQALDDGYETDLPIRVRHAFYDDIDHTIIEADVDRNDVYELSIILDGVTVPLTIGGQFA